MKEIGVSNERVSTSLCCLEGLENTSKTTRKHCQLEGFVVSLVQNGISLTFQANMKLTRYEGMPGDN